MRSRCALVLIALFLTADAGCTCDAQEFLSGWFDRSDRAKAGQPHWMTPVVTVTPRLEQEFRTDFVVQRTAAGSELVNFGNSKGLELIPSEHVELISTFLHIFNAMKRACTTGLETFHFWVSTGLLPLMKIAAITF
jgi:hypothetical protein